MPTHLWGDPVFDWHALDEAATYIGEGLRKWRVDVRQYKEKWGELRCYCDLGIRMWHQIFWPGYVANQYPWHWLWVLDIRLWWIWPPLNRCFIAPFHAYLYRRYHRRAIEKWPHIREEILGWPDYPELLKGL